MSALQAPSDPAQWQSSNPSGAVQDPGHDDTVTSDAIREGKQRAREAMSAAGLDTSDSPVPSTTSNLANGAAQGNGTPQLSRKRSRDGSQIPLSTIPPPNLNSADAKAHKALHDEILLDRYIQQDLLHGVALNDQALLSRQVTEDKSKEMKWYKGEIARRRMQDPGSIFGYGYAGYGNGATNTRPQLTYSAHRPPPKGRRSKELRVARADNARQAEQHEELVPIRLDIELDKLRVRDTFTWNLHEKVISQDMFADHLVEDLKVPLEAVPEFSRHIKAEMAEQIQNYYPHLVVKDDPLEVGRPYTEYKDDELRVQIKLNITIGRVTLVDQFEWDINNPHNSPEEFARQMALENALSGEFTTAIAHSIREQAQLYTKSLFLTNHCFDGRPVEDPELKESFLPAPIHSAFRPQQAQKDYTPYMYEMSEAEFDRTETSMMREHRAQKRQLNRRGGPALPDLKDRQRTVRSLLVHSVIPGAVETFETTGIPKTRRGGRVGRRAGVRNDGDVDSEDLDSDDSSAESPGPSAVTSGGTARTRGMRGAASAAQAAMRAGYGRSGTPDSQILATPDARSSNRRSMLREESLADNDDSLIVRLKIHRTKYRHWWNEYTAKKRASEFPLSGYASQPAPPPSVAVQAATPVKGGGGAGTPSITPRTLPRSRSTPQSNGSHSRTASSTRQNVQYSPNGAVDITHWPGPDDHPPPPPPWLQTAIATLREQHPADNFAPLMRPSCVSAESGDVLTRTHLAPGDPAPAGARLQYLPRIRCSDCPGKLYTALPQRVLQDFEVHLKNRVHTETVAKRQAQAGKS